MRQTFKNLKELCSMLNIINKDYNSCIKEIIDNNDICYIKHGTINKKMYMVKIWDYTIHNLLNKTYGKKNVPTIYTTNYSPVKSMYCPHCKKHHNNIDYEGSLEMTTPYMFSKRYFIDIEKITCNECKEVYDIRDIKIINGTKEIICGDIFIDENKISISYKYTINSLKENDAFYYEDGYRRLTLNTKTGYSYTTNKGHAYKELKKIYRNKKMPFMFNSTYNHYLDNENIFYAISEARIIEKLKNVDNKEELLKLAENNLNCEIQTNAQKTIKEFATILSEKVQNNFDYKIPSLQEHYKTYCENRNFDKDQIRIEKGVVKIFKTYNRFVNINPFEKATWELTDRYIGLKSNKIHREEINIISGIYKAYKVKIGKKARALTQKEIYNYNLLLNIAAYGIAFKNPDNIYKFLNIAISNGFVLKYSIFYNLKAIKLWLKYRSENYVVKEIIDYISKKHTCKDDKISYMKDTVFMIEDIKQKIDNFDIDKIVKFKNEKQFHDDVTRYYNSDEYHMLVNKEEYKKEFELEQEVLSLETPEENIFIGKNRGQLSEIGRKMNICVGGYSDSVETGQCRIAYIMNENDENNKDYLACIELKPIKTNKKNTYSIVQAKLKYNKLVSTDIDIYTKIFNWATKNNISIDTYDMELKKEMII